MTLRYLLQAMLMFAALLTSPNSTSAVIYDYYELSESTGGYSYSGQIIFSDQAYLAGSVSGSIDFFSLCYQIDPDTGDVVIDCEESDIDSVSMYASGGNYGPFAMNWFAPFEFNPYETTIYYDFVFDDLLSGSFYWFNSYLSDLAMSGDSIWSVDNAGSDIIQSGCLVTDSSICSGASGKWVLDASSVPTPITEPATLWLFCIGLAILVFRDHSSKQT